MPRWGNGNVLIVALWFSPRRCPGGTKRNIRLWLYGFLFPDEFWNEISANKGVPAEHMIGRKNDYG